MTAREADQMRLEQLAAIRTFLQECKLYLGDNNKKPPFRDQVANHSPNNPTLIKQYLTLIAVVEDDTALLAALSDLDSPEKFTTKLAAAILATYSQPNPHPEHSAKLHQGIRTRRDQLKALAAAVSTAAVKPTACPAASA